MPDIDKEKQILDAVIDGYKPLGLGKKDEETLKWSALAGFNHAQEREIEDMLAFIQWGKDNDKSPGWIASNLMHDLNGIALPEPCFLPRTSGYADLVKKQGEGGSQ